MRVGTKGAGWLHRLRDDNFVRQALRQRRVVVEAPAKPTIDFDAMAEECEAVLGPHRRGILAAELGVSPNSLSRLQVGWSQRHRSYTFPMRAADGQARGIRLRGTDGRKWSVTGGREGLFLPNPDANYHLLICEGPTDCAALLDLGFDAVGRPSCAGGTRLLVEYVAKLPDREVTIVSDADLPGQRGARNLAVALVPYVTGVRIITPPDGVKKDMRDWKRCGATRADVLDAIYAEPILQLLVAAKEVAR